MPPGSDPVGPLPKARRAGPLLVLAGFSTIGLGVLLQGWVIYHYYIPVFRNFGSLVQQQHTLSEWAIVNSLLIGTGALLAVVGWGVWEGRRSRGESPQVLARSVRRSLGFALAGLGGALVVGAEYFNALTTFAALVGHPWRLPDWILFGSLNSAMMGGGLVLIGVGWFARTAD